MSLQERTLVVKNFDSNKITKKLLEELCLQAGPVRNVVIKPDHAFVEYEDIESVGYAKALLEGISFQGKRLVLEPKVRSNISMKYSQILEEYINYDRNQKAIQQQQQEQQQQQQQQQQQMIAYYQQQHLHQHPYPQPQPHLQHQPQPPPHPIPLPPPHPHNQPHPQQQYHHHHQQQPHQQQQMMMNYYQRPRR